MIKGLVFPDFLPRFVGRIEQSVDRDRTQILFQERIERPGLPAGRRTPASAGATPPPGKVNSAQLTPGAKSVASPAPKAIFRRHSLRGAQIDAERESGFSDTQHGPAVTAGRYCFAAIRPPTKSP